MNSSVNPFSESSNAAFERVTISSQAGTEAESSPNLSETTLESVNRQQPIPPPSEPMQYRAIGLVRGKYVPSSEQFTKGVLLTSDGVEIETVLLGRIMSLVRNHLDLSQEHLWVVYPRTQPKEGTLHLQVVGVWEPDKLAKQQNTTDQGESPAAPEEMTSTAPFVEDGYFSVRGEIVYQSAPDEHFIVKIKQAPRKDSDKPKYFKLKLNGDLKSKAVGQFWDLHAKRQEKDLVLTEANAIAILPAKPKLKRGGPPRKGGYPFPKRNSETPRPVRKTLDSKPTARPIPKSSVPKPIKRPKPPN
ncbi:hypothetical protein Glo7428_2385 [Gloeocapsa sp. PCC 7428]|uniref:hypothetical protein n=1 Tax=Gloeocapsa sp. PCC 7428 TaxID=1173026 RepID=UPI0002A5C96E|nr:hypothetical protein [Gloeocapsa sp. PCC 7428]AFZ30896.1 hypothetical protein Glo7428_2385 [Gloeocapsa sp. PCC 7428]